MHISKVVQVHSRHLSHLKLWIYFCDYLINVSSYNGIQKGKSIIFWLIGWLTCIMYPSYLTHSVWHMVGPQWFLWRNKWRTEHNNIGMIPSEGLQLNLFLLDASVSGNREKLCSLNWVISSFNKYFFNWQTLC